MDGSAAAGVAQAGQGDGTAGNGTYDANTHLTSWPTASHNVAQTPLHSTLGLGTSASMYSDIGHGAVGVDAGEDGLADDPQRKRGASDGAIPDPASMSPTLSRTDRSRLRRDIKKDEEFHSLFPNIPPTELLLYDYSCALQKDILLHGRLFVTEKAIYFRSNILGWETTAILPFIDVAAITKERTALFIPNAIQITTREAKYTFSSFISRDQTYANIWRVWRTARQEQAFSVDGMPVDMPMDDGGMEILSGARDSPQTGDEGCISDGQVDTLGEVGVAASSRRVAQSRRFTAPSISLQAGATPSVAAPGLLRNGSDMPVPIAATPFTFSEAPSSPPGPSGLSPPVDTPLSQPSPQLPLVPLAAQSSPSAEVTVGAESMSDVACGCALHPVKEVFDDVFDANPATLYSLLFTDSPFFREVFASRQNNNLVAGVWVDGRRELSYTTPVKAKMGPPVAECNEKQRLVVPAVPSRYIVETEVITPNVPYGDTFAIVSRYCITSVAANKARVKMFCEVKFLKSGWSVNLAKGFIESNCYDGLKDYSSELRTRLSRYVSERSSITTTVSQSVEPTAIKRPSIQRPVAVPATPKPQQQLGRLVTPATALLLILSLLLLAANMLLFIRLHDVETRFAAWQADLNGEIASIFGSDVPATGEGWVARLQQLQHAHAKERMKWIHSIERLRHGLGAVADVLNSSVDGASSPGN
eukprot:Opistho-2@15900